MQRLLHFSWGKKNTVLYINFIYNLLSAFYVININDDLSYKKWLFYLFIL